MTSISTHFSLAKALYSFINTFLDISAISVADVLGLGKVASGQSRERLRCKM
jgi:hypothetical protein